jgi:SAM-dependent methyltransferase
MVVGPDISSTADLERVRRGRRHPRRTQPDYLHLRALVRGLEAALADVPLPVHDVLDVWCGSRPYDDLLPEGARCVGLDVVGNPYGIADVVSDEILPFDNERFDLVLCIQAFQYMPDPEHVVAELSRVLRPGGTALVSVVFGYEYARASAFEGRYTEHQLRDRFARWDDVRIREDGGRAIAWGVLTGSLLFGLEQRLPRLARSLLRPLLAGGYALVNGVAAGLGRLEHVGGAGAALPMNLTLTARKPAA